MLPQRPTGTDLFTRPLAAFFLIASIAAFIYSNTLSAPFVFDDNNNIEENFRIKNLGNFLDVSGTRYVGYLSFALNYHFGESNVFGYHLVNLLIHITNGFLVYCLVLLLFRAAYLNPRPDSGQTDRSAPASLWIALATALLFIAHPIQTQAVTYIVQRFASLVTLFYLLAVVCYLKWRLTAFSTQKRHWYAGALISTLLAMKTKENSFTLPLMIVLIEAVFFRPFTKKRWVLMVPFLWTLLIIPFSRVDAVSDAEEGVAQETTAISRSDYLWTQFRVIVTYLRLLLLPTRQNVDYDYPIYRFFFEPPVLLSFLFLSSLFVLAFHLLFNSKFKSVLGGQNARLGGFGILWFFLTLSVESSIIPIRDVIFEHRLYLPSMGFFLTGSVMMESLWVRLGSFHRWMRLGTLWTLVAIFSIAAHQRNRVWQDEVRLWTDVVQKSPQKARGHNNLGKILFQQERVSEALVEIETALKLNPDYVPAHNNQALIYYKQGNFPAAVREFETALRLNPNEPMPHFNLALILAKQGRFEDAAREYHAGLGLDPTYIEGHYNLGMAYKKMGRTEEARTHFEHALQISPRFEPAQKALLSLVQSGRGEENSDPLK